VSPRQERIVLRFRRSTIVQRAMTSTSATTRSPTRGLSPSPGGQWT